MSWQVLVVDDSAIVRRVIRKTLRLCGVPPEMVLEAENGREGLEALASRRVDLVLVDLDMPVMDGEQMLAEIGKSPRNPGPSVLVLSGGEESARIAKIRAGGGAVVAKPVAPETLRDRILEVLGVKHEELVVDPALSCDGPDF